ncbi:MAG: S53 family peptidase [Nocardioidaceae bacterium]
MKRPAKLAVAAALAALITGPAVASTAASMPASHSGQAVASACGTAAPMHARCLVEIRTDRHASVGKRGTPAGFGAPALESAYNLPISRGGGQTIAVVDAYDDPNAAADLAKYRHTYGLPPCTIGNGCFKKVNQAGRPGNFPPPDSGWAVEISLDLDMVSAGCPQCHIVLVEARSSSVDDLGTAVDTAAARRADAITNSYGLDEFNGMRRFFGHYEHSGSTVLASSGDYGFGPAQFPAVTPGVVAVGGTSLYAADNSRDWTEKAWSGAGSGCSAYVTKPAYQTDKHCGMRTLADVSAVADPYTGVAVYDSYPNPFGLPRGWLVVGGTSASAPLVAGVIGLAGNGSSFHTSYAYRHTAALFDVVGGSNGFCGHDYLCMGKRGYDGPTGLGAPNGIGAF